MIIDAEFRNQLRPVLEQAMDDALANASKSSADRLKFECRLDDLTDLDHTPDGAELPERVLEAAVWFGLIEL